MPDESSIERVRRMFEYEAWCTPRVLESIRRAEAGVKESGLAALVPPLERAVEVFGHIQAAKRIWLSRVSTLTGPPGDGVFPVWDLPRCEREATEMDGLWGEFLGALQEPGLAEAVRYTSLEGAPYESVLFDILTHVANHGTYHRGQIALLVAQTGTKPAATDFIAFTRRPA